MPLTSVRLIVLAAVLTAGALAVTVLVWRRWGRWRYLVRPSGVLLTEALLVFTVGLVVNRSEEFYPSWDALVTTSDPAPASYHTSAGGLDAWLATQPGVRTFAWKPSGWASWHLASAPMVTVPVDYLAHPSLRYPAVVVINSRAWTVPPSSEPAVVVNVTTTAGTTAGTLGVALPGMLGRDLRVTSHRWALVASGADGTLARKVVAADRGRYPAVAFVGVAAPGHALKGHPASAVHPKSPVRAKSPAGAAHPQHGVGATTASGYDTLCSPVHSPVVVHSPASKTGTANCPTVTLPPGVLPAGILTAYFPAVAGKTLTNPLKPALDWAVAQTPPPLAASAPEPTYVKPEPRKPHKAKPKPSSKAVKRGPRQPHA